MPAKKSKQVGKPTNKAKAARRTFAPKTAKYKTDHQAAVCSAFVDTVAAITHESGGQQTTQGTLANIGPIADNGPIAIAASIALDARTNILASHRHATLTQMFNEWNTSAMYLDLLFSPELRKNCDQVFLLVERGIRGVPTNVAQMVSDVNCRMYQLGDNTQKLTFKKIFSTTQDKINKKSSVTDIDPNNTYYLKVLCTGKNSSGAQLNIGDCQIKIRARMFNKYSDMKALSAALN
jgi:hypothetical protein